MGSDLLFCSNPNYRANGSTFRTIVLLKDRWGKFDSDGSREDQKMKLKDDEGMDWNSQLNCKNRNWLVMYL